MALGRRGIFRGLLSIPVAKVGAPLLRYAPVAAAPVAARFPGLSSIITATLRHQSAKLAETVMRNNALLQQLQRMR